jgi:hypothetical protein
MPEEVYKIIRDLDQDGEFFDPIYEYSIKEQIHGERCQEKEDPDEQKETLNFVLLSEEEDSLLPCFSLACEVETTSLSDEEFEDLVEAAPTSTSPAHQEENMMSYNPFEKLDDALFHDFGNEENTKRISMKFLLQKA